jgi:hypothetical protein
MTDHDGVEQVITMAWRAQIPERQSATTARRESPDPSIRGNLLVRARPPESSRALLDGRGRVKA